MSNFVLETGVKFKQFSPEEMFQFAKNHGIKGLDYVSSIPNLFTSPEYISNLSKKYKVPITSIHQPPYLIPYAPSFLFERMINLVKLFPNVDTYVIHLSSVLNLFQQDPKHILQLAKIAKRNNVILAVESNTPFFILKYYPRVTLEPDKFASFCINNNLKIALDTSHIAAMGGNIVEFYKQYYTHIQIIHLSDYKVGIEHLPLGVGNLPIDSLLNEMKKTHYSNKVYLEIKKIPMARQRQDKLTILSKSIEIVRTYLS